MTESLANTLLNLVYEHYTELLIVGNLAVLKLMAEQEGLYDAAELKRRAVFTAIVDAHELILRFDTAKPTELKLLNGFALN